MRSDQQHALSRWLAVGAALLLLVLATTPVLAQAQEAETQEAETQEGEEKQEEETGFLERPIGDNWVLSPIILPIYSPETEFALAIGGVATFSTKPENEELPRSTMSLFAIPSSNDSLGFNWDLSGFWLDDRIRLEVVVDYDDGTSNYWGVGYEPAREIGDDEDLTEFQRAAFELPLVLSFRVGKSLFLGLNFDLIDMDVEERSPTMQTSPHFLALGDEIQSVGVGVNLTYDSRDDTLNAYSGRYFNAEATFYLDSLGSDQEFETYEADYRQYHQIKRAGRTFAWQLFGQLAEGEVPWIRMPTVGSSSDLRGYTQGRFRDLAAAWGLVEYRHMTDKKLWKRGGRQGFAVWGGLGFIGKDFGDLSGHELPNVGIGYRIEVQPRRSLRLDVGYGHDEVGFYLNFAEAF